MYPYDPFVEKADRNCIVVGRAATGIYLILKQIQDKTGQDKKTVIVPANLCYAAIFPILYVGYKPVFCDVDAVTGNVTYETFSSVCNEGVIAAIIPHMYGNPVLDMPAIVSHCKSKGITLIEDCASAMGASADDYALGAAGDYTVYSTGYSKTLDLGFGGIVSSVHDLKAMEQMEESFTELLPESLNNLVFFGKLYRLMRNEGQNTLIERSISNILPECCRDGMLYKINLEQKDHIWQGLAGLSDVIKQRRLSLLTYKSSIVSSQYMKYPYATGAVPWRYNMLIEPGIKRKLINMLLDEGLPVSDWYPRVTPLFNAHCDFPGAQWHENYILNVPVLLDESKILRICQVINYVLQ